MRTLSGRSGSNLLIVEEDGGQQAEERPSMTTLNQTALATVVEEDVGYGFGVNDDNFDNMSESGLDKLQEVQRRSELTALQGIETKNKAEVEEKAPTKDLSAGRRTGITGSIKSFPEDRMNSLSRQST